MKPNNLSKEQRNSSNDKSATNGGQPRTRHHWFPFRESTTACTNRHNRRSKAISGNLGSGTGTMKHNRAADQHSYRHVGNSEETSFSNHKKMSTPSNESRSSPSSTRGSRAAVERRGQHLASPPVLVSPPPTRRVTRQQPTNSRLAPSSMWYPYQSRASEHRSCSNIPKHLSMNQAANIPRVVVGPPQLQIYRLKLPNHLLHLLDPIVYGCEAHAATLKDGWFTNLYSLTRQDIALRKTSNLYEVCRPIQTFILKCMQELYHARRLVMDSNQPHVLRYSAEEGHTGVQEHHDKCDLTANVCLSRSSSFHMLGQLFALSLVSSCCILVDWCTVESTFVVEPGTC